MNFRWVHVEDDEVKEEDFSSVMIEGYCRAISAQRHPVLFKLQVQEAVGYWEDVKLGAT